VLLMTSPVNRAPGNGLAPAVWLAVAGLTFAQTRAVEIKSTEHRVALIELYTSEGCSSCPPAEAWLGRLKEEPGLWTDFVPVAFHVDYWDHLGWRDPWAVRSFAERQRRYAKDWGAESVYTPAIVLNGREWRDWRIQRGEWRKPSPKPGVLTAASVDFQQWKIAFTPGDAVDRVEVNAVLLWSGVRSDVKAGENRGRRLAHEFVVAAQASAPLMRQGGAFHGNVMLRPHRAVAADATLALAVWVTRAGRLEPLQAAGGWLPGVPGGARSQTTATPKMP